MRRKIRDLIRSITKNSDDYDEKYIKIKLNLDHDLPLNKMVEILTMTIVVIMYKVFLDGCLYKL